MSDVVRFHVSEAEPTEDNSDNIPMEESAPNLENMSLEEYLKSERCSLFDNILNELKNVNQVKWSLRSTEDLYPELLTNGDILESEVTEGIAHYFSRVAVHYRLNLAHFKHAEIRNPEFNC